MSDNKKQAAIGVTVLCLNTSLSTAGCSITAKNDSFRMLNDIFKLDYQSYVNVGVTLFNLDSPYVLKS